MILARRFFMSTETIIKIKKRVNPYTMIDTSIFLNEKISWKAKGLMGYFLSRPEDWKINLKDLYKQSIDGYDSVKSGLRELKKYGYLELRPIKANGKFASWEYIVHEVPFIADECETLSPQEGFPLVENPLEENPPVEKPLKGNPLEGYPPKEKPLEDNPPHTNKDITNNDYTNKDYTNDFDNEKNDLLLLKKYEAVLAKCKINVFEDSIAKIVEESLKGLYFDEEFSRKNLNLPLTLVRNTLEKINPCVIEDAITRMKKALASGITISSTKHYLMTCIFNSITDYMHRELVESNIYKPKKTIFELVKGTQFESSVNLLSSSFSEIVFNTFFKDKVTNIALEGGNLTLTINDAFVATTLSQKYTEKVKECFKELDVENVIFTV